MSIGGVVMKIENKLTLAHLKQNKRRTIITIIGIIISVAMIVSVFIGVASFMDYYERSIISVDGNHHFSIMQISDEKLEILKNDDRIESVGLQEYGRKDSSGVRLKDAENIRYATAYINWYNEDAFSQMCIDDLDGRFPQNKNEIMLSRGYLKNNKLDLGVGDTITLQLGRRREDLEHDYFHISLTGDYRYGEVFDFKEERSFVISGIINDKQWDFYNSQMYSVCDENSSYYASIKLKKLTPFSIATINDIAKNLGANPNDLSKSNIFLNEELLATHFCGSVDSQMVTKIIPMAVAILLIILVAAFMLIYNAFGISINERTKYLGMLSSVGATKRQKLGSMYFEGVVLSVIGVPVGVAFGIGIIALALKLISSDDFGIIPRFVLPAWSLVVGILFCIITIFFSLSITAKRVAHISAIDAIKQNNAVEYKSSRSPKIIKKLFGVEGTLAYKNFRRNGKKNRIITASIAISAVLFLCVNYYCTIMMSMNGDRISRPYQVEFGFEDNDKVMQDIAKIDSIKDIYSLDAIGYSYGKEDTNFESDRNITEINNTTRKYKHLWDAVNVSINFIDDDDFNTLCRNNNIDPKPYYESDNWHFKCVIMNNIDHKKNGKKVFNDNIIGCELKANYYNPIEDKEMYDDLELAELSDSEVEQFLKEWNENMHVFEISAMVDYDKDFYACNLDSEQSISAYLPNSMSSVYAGGEQEYKNYGIETDEHQYVAEEIRQYFDSHPEYAKDSAYVGDDEQYALQIMKRLNTIKLFMYAFILLISIITIANIINTITTSINARKREFAMIKSVGITPKDFARMISLESLFYGIESLLFAIPLSVGINIALNKIVGDGRIPFDINILMYLIVILAVFVLVGGTMLYSIHKIKNDNIIENLKRDNL